MEIKDATYIIVYRFDGTGNKHYIVPYFENESGTSFLYSFTNKYGILSKYFCTDYLIGSRREAISIVKKHVVKKNVRVVTRTDMVILYFRMTQNLSEVLGVKLKEKKHACSTQRS